ncbi:MAG: histidine phosphatase family protein [Pseudomonadota bacterium]
MEGIGRRRIFLMRHGHVDYFNPDLTDPRQAELTEEGRAQASAAAQALSEQPFDIAISSGLKRTHDTAQIILDGHRDPPELEAHLGLEEIKSGFLRVGSREELAARLAFCFDDADADDARFLPDGETFKSVEARVTQAIEDIVLDRAWRTALIVAHEGVNRVILGWACGGGLKTVSAFEQDLCCVNVIDIDVTPTEPAAGDRADNSKPLQIERIILKAVNVTPYDYLKEGLPRTSLEHLFGVDFGGVRPR